LVTVSMIAGQFLTLCIKRGGFPVDWSVLMRIIVPSAAALLIAPLLYFALRFLVPIAPDDSGDRKPAGFGV